MTLTLLVGFLWSNITLGFTSHVIATGMTTLAGQAKGENPDNKENEKTMPNNSADGREV